jgi:hypothetical protein
MRIDNEISRTEPEIFHVVKRLCGKAVVKHIQVIKITTTSETIPTIEEYLDYHLISTDSHKVTDNDRGFANTYRVYIYTFTRELD